VGKEKQATARKATANIAFFMELPDENTKNKHRPPNGEFAPTVCRLVAVKAFEESSATPQ
jgi:hypothetical protein